MADAPTLKRRFLIPEVVQTSAMDCGPAALKALFGGFNRYLSYGRLREACQTDVDGTSIDTIEIIAGQLGLASTQSMLPPDLLLLKSSACLPAIVVTLSSEATHFAVLWRVHGPWVQVMDPAAGRMWMSRRHFLNSLYIHEHAVSAAAWQEWSHAEVFTSGLEDRMRALGMPATTWTDRAQQDAALRLAGTLRANGKLRGRVEARQLLDLCQEDAAGIPPEFWTVRAHPHDPEQLIMRGAVLLSAGLSAAECDPAAVPASLQRVRTEPEPEIWGAAWAVLRDSGWVLPAMTAIGVCAAAFGTVIEALLFRALFDMGRHLQSTAERFGAIAALLIFLSTVLALDWPASLGLSRIGRQFELGLRARFLMKVPRLSDRYFQSRLISDMAFRAHWLQLLRQLPGTAGHVLSLVTSIVVTCVAIAWVYPGTALRVGVAAIAACAIPLLILPAMGERDLRFREISASLGTFYLDSLLGSRAVQAHGAERSMRAAHARQLRQWAAAGLHQQALFVRAEILQMALTFGFVIAMVYRQASASQSPAGLLLLIYWSIAIPSLGQEVAAVARSLPAMRNTLLRFLELIGSPDEETRGVPGSTNVGGVEIDMQAVTVVMAGRKVLEDVTVHVAPGEQVGIVGVSGAGKSSLLGCLLGWHPASSGSVLVDGAPLDAARLSQLRSSTAWIDPQVHLFRSSLYENLRYGNGADPATSIEEAIDVADLDPMLRRSSDGLQTAVAEGGASLSGGEGQRLRAARAFGRPGVRLAILDEPARGLGRDQRRRLLVNARQRFAQATLLCVTHDVSDTVDFDRILVIENGRIVEQGPPQSLRAIRGSRYEQLLAEEGAVNRELWGHAKWRRWRLSCGALSESRRVLP
jgi:ABC-type bacteriocin/lantibiotic exporter with double-glycine peptidase domain